MKRITFGILFIALIIGSLIPAIMAEDTAPAADTSSVKKIVLADFEDSSMNISTWADPNSKITVDYTTDQVHDGKQAIVLNANTGSSVAWDGAAFLVPAEKADWNGMTTFTVWIYGSGTKKGYDIELQDAGKELFMYVVKDNWTGWQQLTIPLKKFVWRSDYQASDAKVNRKIDYPLIQVQFFNTNNMYGSGKLTLYFDQFEVTNE